jgi:DNA-damage-inducible protein D family protein
MKAEEIKELFKKFEEAAQEVEGIECWSARDLQTLLGYAQWRNFELIIQKAKVSCSSVGENIAYHFADVSKMVTIGSGAEKQIDDLILTTND